MQSFVAEREISSFKIPLLMKMLVSRGFLNTVRVPASFSSQQPSFCK